MSYKYEIVKLGELCSNVCSGGTPSTKKDEYYKGGTIPWLNTKEISFNNIYDTETYITKEGLNNSSAKWIDSDCINVAMYGATAGKISINKIPLTTNQACCNLKLDSEKADYRYIYYWFKLNYNFLASLANGGAQQNLNSGIIKDLDIRLPKLKVQKKVAIILSSFDKKIELNTRINSHLHKLCELLYEDLVKNTPKVTLSNFINKLESGKREKGGSSPDGIPSIGAEKIEKFGIYDYSSEKYISNSFFKNINKGKVLSGDVLLYKDGAYTGKVTMALNGFPYDKCAINEHVFKINSLDNKFQNFIYFSLYDPLIKEKVQTLASSKAAQPGLNQSELKSVEVPSPKDEEIIEFEKHVQPFMNLIANNALENKKLADMRDALLPKLMSGEIEIRQTDYYG